MSLRTASQAAALASYNQVKAREAAIFRTQRIRDALRAVLLVLGTVAVLCAAAAAGFLAGLAAAPGYYGMELGVRHAP
jgi:hypothetical protein